MNKEERTQKIIDIGNEIRNNEKFLRSKNYIQHGNTSVYSHVHSVADMSLILSEKFNLHLNDEDLVRSALLHDFYDYDWHIKRKRVYLFKMHGFVHPLIAKENALNEFNINDKTANII